MKKVRLFAESWQFRVEDCGSSPAGAEGCTGEVRLTRRGHRLPVPHEGWLSRGAENRPLPRKKRNPERRPHPFGDHAAA